MSEVMIHLLSVEDAEELLHFELENRSFFEQYASPRGDEYYQLDNLPQWKMARYDPFCTNYEKFSFTTK